MLNDQLSEFEILPSGAPDSADYSDLIKEAKKDIENSDLFDVRVQRRELKAHKGKKVTLSDFDKHASETFPVGLPGYVFVEFVWLDLSKIKLEDIKKLNEKDGARVKDDKSRAELLADYIKTVGFRPDLGCPQVLLEDGMPITGRGRIRSFMMNDEPYCPVAVYVEVPTDVMTKDELLQHEKNKMLAANWGNNRGVPRTKTSYDSFVRQIVLLKRKGIVTDEESCKEYLYSVGAQQTLTAASIGKVYSSAERSIKKAESAMHNREEESAVKWLEAKGWVRNEDYVLFNFKDVTYAKRLWTDHILTSGKHTLPIIGYTSDFSYSDAKQNATVAEEFLKNAWCDTVKKMNSRLAGLTLDVDNLVAPYTLEGFIPQSVDDHDIEGDLILKAGDY